MTFDFLRGILIASVARDAVNFANYALPIHFPWSLVSPMFRVGIVVVLAAYALVLWAVLWRPSSTGKIVFAILLVMAGLMVGSVVTSFFGSVPKSQHISLFGVLVTLSGPPLTAAIAGWYLLKLKSSAVA